MRDFHLGATLRVGPILSERERSTAEWDWLFRNAPDGSADVLILTAGGRVAGSIAHVPVTTFVEGRRVRLAIGCDLMVDPEFRGRGGAKRLVTAFVSSNRTFDLNFGVVNDKSARVTGRYLGSTVMGRVPQWRRFNSRATRRNVLLHHVATIVERVYAAVVSWPRSPLAVTDLASFDTEVDRLAEEMARFAPCVRVRDSAYLRWHWLQDPRTQWRIRAVRAKDGELHGIAVIGARVAQGVREGVVADLLTRDAAALRALMLDARTRLVEQGCDRVVCTYLDRRPWSTTAMRRSGFRPCDGPLVACGPLSSTVDETVGKLDAWYLTHGDTDI